MEGSPTNRTERMTERVAENAFLKLFARASMLGILPLCGWLISEVVSLRNAASRAPDQIALVETRIVAKIDQVEARAIGRVSAAESRLNDQSRRLEVSDNRAEKLSREVSALTVSVAVLVSRIDALLIANPPMRLNPPQ